MKNYQAITILLAASALGSLVSCTEVVPAPTTSTTVHSEESTVRAPAAATSTTVTRSSGGF